MKSKIYILILILSLIAVVCSFGQSVPNTSTFNLQNVVDVVNPTTDDLQDCFNDAVPAYFDPTYNTDSYAPANSLLRFRNYTISAGSPPTVIIATITNITDVSASGGGEVTDDGGLTVTSRGLVWSTSNNPTISSYPGGGISTDGTGTGTFTTSMTSLTCGNLYYVRAYATNSAGTSYHSASSVQFRAEQASASNVQYLFNSLSSNACGATGDFTSTYATALKAIQDKNTCSVTFTNSITLYTTTAIISVGTQYYDRPGGIYSCKYTGTGYFVLSQNAGANQIIQISNGVIQNIFDIGLPTFNSQSSAQSITTTGFQVLFGIADIGCCPITEAGIVVKLGVSTPTTSDLKFTVASPGVGNFTGVATGLTPNKQYSFRAYAINSAGTAYYQSTFTATTLGSELITTSKTWNCPTGVSSITVEAWGGGGAGGGATGTASRGGGGAGGSYSIGTATVVAGNNYTVTIGAGGIASTTLTRPGGNTSFAAQVIANGGAGAATTSGTNGNGATAITTGSVGTTIYAGGNGGNGVASGTSGGGGGGAGSTGAGNSATTGTAGLAKSDNGGAGGNGVTVANTRNNGAVYGGGGSGGLSSTTTDRTGGNGAAGLIRITYP